MEEAESNVDEGRRQTAPFLKTCDNEYVTSGVDKSSPNLWFICSYRLYENAEKKDDE